jgi:hypothetical protein
MDPLTAFSVAGTVIQFVDFGHQLLRNSVQLYKSSRGALKANEELELVTGDVQCVISKLQGSLFAKQSDFALPMAKEDGCQETFMKICDEAAKIATELLEKLNGLKVDKGKQRKWESLKAAVRAAWSKEEIESLEKRLLRLKESIKLVSLELLR